MQSLTTDDLRDLVTQIASMTSAIDDADRIERIRHFEELKSAISAAQAVVAVDFDRSQRAGQAVAGVPATRQGRGVAEQVALARRVSPWQGRRWLGWAKILTSELPATFAELTAGRASEWRTMLLARETAVLSREDRAAVDAELAPHLGEWGDRRVDAETRKAAYRLDPKASVERARRAEQDRRVTVRPAPDTMARLNTLVPVAQGVACYASLKLEADRLIGVGDDRSHGQIMADTLVARVTGQADAAAVPVEINLVMTEETLLRGGDEPGWVDGYGPVPAGWARDMATNHRDVQDGIRDAGRDTSARHAQDKGSKPARWIRRLYQRHGALVAMESRRRLFPDGAQRFINHRDQTCRTPWCEAPIAHTDHIDPHANGGATDIDNAQGLCATCNHARQAGGWRSRVQPDGAITTTTPTGHRYTSTLPTITGPPGPSRPARPATPPRSPLELHFAQLIEMAA